jgi:hypothetical protein
MAAETCETQLPKPKFSLCDPEVNFGQIQKLYLTNPGYPLTDVEDLEEWTDRLSNTSDDVDAIREITVIGEKPEAEETSIQISLNRTVSGPMNHTIPFEIDETNDTNYAWMRSYQGGPREVTFWYENEAGKIFGGDSGIRASISVKYVTPRESTDLEKIMGSLTWKNKQDPERHASPLADSGSSGS